MPLATYNVYAEKCSKILATKAFLSLPIKSFESFESNGWDSSGRKLFGKEIFPGHNFLALNTLLVGLGTTAETPKKTKLSCFEKFGFTEPKSP